MYSSQLELGTAAHNRDVPAEIFRMVVTLEARGYLLATGDRYVLSLRLFQLAYRHQPVRSLVPTALPLMTRLAKQAGQVAATRRELRGDGVANKPQSNGKPALR